MYCVTQLESPSIICRINEPQPWGIRQELNTIHFYIYLSIHLSIHLSIFPSSHPSSYSSSHLSIHPSFSHHCLSLFFAGLTCTVLRPLCIMRNMVTDCSSFVNPVPIFPGKSLDWPCLLRVFGRGPIPVSGKSGCHDWPVWVTYAALRPKVSR